VFDREMPSHVRPLTNLQIEEVKGVNQVLDQEEEIAMKEFARFEEKLRQQKGPGATASISSLDSFEAPG
jgi:hypothetical protein